MIEEAIARALAEGWTLISDAWGAPSQKRCCAIGAVAVQNGFYVEGSLDFVQVCKHLGWTEGEVWNFVSGFDDCERWRASVDISPNHHAYGRELRERYLGTSKSSD